MIEVIETLADGTTILSNGFRLLPSVGKIGGERVKLTEMSPAQREQWQAALLTSLGAAMSDYYKGR